MINSIFVIEALTNIWLVNNIIYNKSHHKLGPHSTFLLLNMVLILTVNVINYKGQSHTWRIQNVGLVNKTCLLLISHKVITTTVKVIQRSRSNSVSGPKRSCQVLFHPLITVIVKLC